MIADTRFNKSFRLLSASDFSRLKSNSKSFKSHTLIIYYQSNSVLNLNHSRLGIAVSKKVGKSHERNRIKRIIREHFRVHSTIKDRPVDFIVVVQKPKKYNELQFVEFESEFVNNLAFAFNKLGSEK